MRLPFLLLTPACVLVGVGTAYWQMGTLNGLHVLLVVVGALSAHISVNVFNEYFDYKSGLDSKTIRTPFSGGSGALQANPNLARAALWLAWVSFFITAIVGLYFATILGWKLLPIGILGLFLLITYTTWWVYNPWLCLIAPGLGFGILMIMGTHFALTGEYSLVAFVASLPATFLVSGLLLLNQFPDVEADKSIGRKHLPIVIGFEKSAWALGSFYLLAYLTVILSVLAKILPVYCLLALVTVPLSWKAFHGAKNFKVDASQLIPAMGMNVAVTLLIPVLLAVGLFIG
ncbi:prenyltransferase [Kangiella koreensis]|uniref:UbiA prenyltransferase n=1 Tax=Kangiella koreensis (strain DSM 16069 / JCM 12317 / KCTC 12182 / SW-125) TaxID=523791 RepID=C7RD54_KANKD|nr:prenyltransferase [Kangiella koreensis]ACV27196.1 UbiA prenyltransferase [Kangiella koreensis DSM 16069]